MTVAGSVKSHSIGGHKEISLEEQERRKAASTTESRDVEALLNNRVLNNAHISRAALYHKDDCALMASSTKQFNLSQDQVRDLLDGLLAAQREVEGTNTTVTGAPPKKLQVEGQDYSFADKTRDAATLKASGKNDIFLVASGIYFVVIESETGQDESIKIVANSFVEGLQAQGM